MEKLPGSWELGSNKTSFLLPSLAFERETMGPGVPEISLGLVVQCYFI